MDMADLKQLLEEAERARAFLAKFDEWMKRAPPIPRSEDGMSTAVGANARMQASDRFAGMMLASAVILAMRDDPKGTHHVKNITETLIEGGMAFTAKNPVTSVSSTLSRAASGGLVVRAEKRGFWRLASVPKDFTASDDASEAEG